MRLKTDHKLVYPSTNNVCELIESNLSDHKIIVAIYRDWIKNKEGIFHYSL